MGRTLRLITSVGSAGGGEHVAGVAQVGLGGEPPQLGVGQRRSCEARAIRGRGELQVRERAAAELGGAAEQEAEREVVIQAADPVVGGDLRERRRASATARYIATTSSVASSFAQISRRWCGRIAWTRTSARSAARERVGDLRIDTRRARVPAFGPRRSPPPLAATTSAWTCATPSVIAASFGASAAARATRSSAWRLLPARDVELREVERGARGDRRGRVGGGEHLLERGARGGLVAGELRDHGVAELGRDAVELGRDAGRRIGDARLRAAGAVDAAEARRGRRRGTPRSRARSASGTAKLGVAPAPESVPTGW